MSEELKQEGSAVQKAFWAGYEDARMRPYRGNIRAAWNEYKASEQFARQAPADGVVVSLADLRAACLGSEQEAAKGLNRLRALLAQQAQGGGDE